MNTSYENIIAGEGRTRENIENNIFMDGAQEKKVEKAVVAEKDTANAQIAADLLKIYKDNGHDDDDNNDLTSLVWLTELRNQNLTWPQSHQTLLDAHDDDDDGDNNQHDQLDTVSYQCNDASNIYNSKDNDAIVPTEAARTNTKFLKNPTASTAIKKSMTIETELISEADVNAYNSSRGSGGVTAALYRRKHNNSNDLNNKTKSAICNNRSNHMNNNGNNIPNKHISNTTNSKKTSNAQEGSQQTITAKRPTPAERYEIFIKKIKNDLLEYEQLAITYQTDSKEKPPFNYSHIIGMAMLENGRVTLQQICNWIKAKFAYFRVNKKWNNSIRHNLSLHYCFRKIDRKKYEKGKGGYWELGVDLKKCDRKRIRNRKTTNKNTATSVSNVPTMSAQQRQRQQHQQLLTQDDNALQQTHESSLILLQNECQENLLEQQQLQVEGCHTNKIDINNHLHTFNHYTVEQPTLLQEQDTEETIINNFVEERQDDDNDVFLTNITSPIEDDQQIQIHQSQQPQYQLGTIIISTLAKSDDMLTTTADTGPMRNDYFSTLLRERVHFNTINKSQKLFLEDEIPAATENVIISSYLTATPDSAATSTVTATVPANINRCNAIVQQLTDTGPSVATLTTETSSSSAALVPTSMYSTNNLQCSIISDNHRPYIDGIDEAFQYLRSMDTNREDILDNLLDISVSDY